MSLDVIRQHFKTLNIKFSEKIDSNISNNDGSALGNLPNFLITTKNFVPSLFPNHTLTNEEREEISAYHAWLFNELIFVSVNCKKHSINESCEILKSVLSNAFSKERWLYFKIISANTSFLLSARSWKTGTSMELIAPFTSSEETFQNLSTKLMFHKIAIANEKQQSQLMTTCMTQLLFSVPLYCNMKKKEEIGARDVIMEILRDQSLLHKKYSLVFFAKYFEIQAEFAREHTQLFLSIMQILSSIFKDIPTWVKDYKEEVEELMKAIEKFLTDTPVELLDFSSGDHIRLLVTYASEILFLQVINSKQPWFNRNIPGLLSSMLVKVLDGNRYPPQAVESLRNLIDLSDSNDVNMLMKYLVLAEVEASNVFSHKLTELSSTWRALHSRASKRIDELPRLPNKLFNITDFLMLAVQVDFCLTRRHQLLHAESPKTCICTSTRGALESQGPLMKFKDWDYKHISYVLLDNLDDFTQKILNTLEQSKIFEDREILTFSIEVFSYILKLSSTSPIIDTLKQVLVAIIASPFYKCLKDDPNYNKLGGFLKVMTLLPNKFKQFFESPLLFEGLDELKCYSIVQLSQLEIARVSAPCLWLLDNIINFTAVNGSDNMKKSLFNCFTNFVINNSGKYSNFLDLYQKLLVNTNNPCPLIEPLHNMLCLTGGNFIILKHPAKKNVFMHTIVCNDCELSSIKYPKSKSKEEEVKRWMAFMVDTRGLLVSPDIIKESTKKLQLNVAKFFAQSNQFKMEMFSKMPAMINHSQELLTFIEGDKGKSFFEGLFSKDPAVLQQLQLHLEDIIQNISKLNSIEDIKRAVFDNCFVQIGQLAIANAYGTDTQMHLLTVNLTFIFATNVVNENNTVKCFKIFLLYIVQNHSQVVGVASLKALQMADLNKMTLNMLMRWHKSFIMRHLTNIICANFFSKTKTSFTASLINFLKRLNLQRLREFVPSHLDMIISVTLPMGIKSPSILTSLEELCMSTTLSQALKDNFMKIYFEIYTTQEPEMRSKCLKYIETKTSSTISELLIKDKKKTVDEALVYYNKSPEFVIDVMKLVHGQTDSEDLYFVDEIIDDIKQRFLGVLIYFEPFLTSNTCERAIKKNILLSLGDIIRLLKPENISGFCFKIITILKAAVEQTSVDLSETCINVWNILIRNCEVTSLAPILGTIIVSLEVFIDKYPAEVNDLYKYLIIDNNNLLSRNISDLFFIEKTRVQDEIKLRVLRIIDSQKSGDDFKLNLQSLLRQMNIENSDIQIRVYCLSYIKELIQKHREEVNELICGRMTIDPLIEELLHILVNNCKSTSEALQLATAECLGELGAIEPSLQRKNYASQQKFPEDIHSGDFAKMALAQLCRSYQYKNDPKYIDSLSLAIQQILRSQNVTENNKDASEVWKAIPEKMRSIMEPLLTSSYTPRLTEATTDHPIFWEKAQTAIDWSYKWGASLIDKILDAETKYLLNCIKPSMRYNQYTTSMFLPYILLHNLTMGDATQHHLINEEIQTVFDIITGKKSLVQQKAEGRKPLFVKWFDFKPLPDTNKKTPENGIKAVAIRVAKMIFEIFDFLENYRRTQDDVVTCSTIKKLLDKFDVEEMAHVNYECGEYARAMIYLETKMKALKESEPKEFQGKLSFLTKVFAKLECSDSVEGVQALKTSEWSLEEKILINNVTGNFQDSAACFERMMQLGEAKVEHVNTMMNTYISLDQPETALSLYENMIAKLDASQQNSCKGIKAEPLWRLSRFAELDELLADKTIQQSTDWGVRCGSLLSTFNKFAADEGEGALNFANELCNTRLALMKNLKVSGSEHTAYGKNYGGVIHLHLISELEKAQIAVKEILNKASSLEILQGLIKETNLRMEFIRRNSAFEDTVLCFHRVILTVTKNVLSTYHAKLDNPPNLEELYREIDHEMGKLWVKSIKLACDNKKYQQAQTYILNAESYQPKDLFIEKAKLHWIKNDQTNAFKTLELGTNQILKAAGIESLSKDEKKIYSKGKLMIARYNAEATNLQFDSNKKLFLDAKVKGAENDKVFLEIAEYMDRFYCTDEDTRVGEPKQMLELMNLYSRSMYFGNEYVFQSMPRLLSIWLDTTAQNNNRISSNRHLKAEIAELNAYAEKAAANLSMFYFYTAFSQLISRICHPSQDVFNVLKTILVQLMLAYPQQSLWFLLPMLKSSHAQRVKRCQEILRDPRVKKLEPLIRDFNWLVDKFITLATVKGPPNKMSLRDYVPDLLKLDKISSIILPFQCNLQVTRTQNSFKFADKFVKIYKIKPDIDILLSMQKPRKVTIVGDDGKEYIALFKPNDDLRIDLRYCEVANVVKEFLHKDPESRHRQLSTRTFSVIPLNETSGLIEWVPNLRTFKSIIMSEYTKKKVQLPSSKEIEKLGMQKLAKEQRLIHFRRIKASYYPALGDYFRQQFPSPQNYYKARSAFIKTTATMSIIGYILGLGDRHGDNIMLDELSGETFHVDFNLLFNRGESLPIPETVPFRLTHNMIDAMGVLGIEGPFKKNCEIILRVLQKEKNTLMSYLRPIIYDTVQKNNETWKKSADGKHGDKERFEQGAVASNKKIEMRLKGIVSKYKGSSEIPLSTEGQVNFIIEEATKEQNLADMYHGWMPWM